MFIFLVAFTSYFIMFEIYMGHLYCYENIIKFSTQTIFRASFPLFYRIYFIFLNKTSICCKYSVSLTLLKAVTLTVYCQFLQLTTFGNWLCLQINYLSAGKPNYRHNQLANTVNNCFFKFTMLSKVSKWQNMFKHVKF